MIECGQNQVKNETLCREVYESIVEKAKTGAVRTHDGEIVRFFSDNFDHAFRTSSDWCAQRYAKDKLDAERVIRARWIEPVISGAVPRSACWSIRDANRRQTYRRMYLVWDENYVVWLQPTDDGVWRFASAYRAWEREIRKYIDNGKEIWRRKD